MIIQKKNLILISLIIILLGATIRIYGANYQNFWWDEMLGFWAANPNINFNETISRYLNHDHTSIIFHFIMKFYYKIVNYSPENGRYVSLLFGIIAIPLIGILLKQVNNNNLSLILCLIICSLNAYLIDYSQELRVYSLIFIISIINLISFLRIILEKKENFTDYLFFGILTIISLSLSPFLIAIVFSQILYCLYKHLFLKVNQKKNILFIILLTILSIVINYKQINVLINIESPANLEPNLNFLKHLFLPSFFGSKIMGLIFLIILIFSLVLNRNKILFKNHKYLFFLILLLSSYSIPLSFYVFGIPLFHDRYIIFVLISFIILISSMVVEINNINIRYSLIAIILVSVCSHSVYKILNLDHGSKPEFNKLFKTIKYSQTKDFIFNYDKNKIVAFKNNQQLKIDKNTKDILENYIKLSKQYLTNDLSLKNFETYTNYDAIWILCYKPLSPEKCNFIEQNNDYELISKIDVNLVSGYLNKKK